MLVMYKKCKKLKNESTENRHNLVKHKFFFASIVFSTHMINTCKSKRHCPEDDCQKRHHTLLHSKEMPVPDSSDQVDSNIINIIEKEILSQTHLQIVPVTLTNNGRDIKVNTNALLDTDLDTTLIQKDITDKLKLTRVRRTMNISSVVTNTRKISSQAVNFIITSQTNKCDCFI